MPMTISCETNMDWNDNILSFVDGVSMVMVCVHKDGHAPDQGKTVSIHRQEFLEMCQAFTRLTPPTDRHTPKETP